MSQTPGKKKQIIHYMHEVLYAVGAPLDVKRGRVARPGGAAAPGGARPVLVRTTETCVALASHRSAAAGSGTGGAGAFLTSPLYRQ